MQICTASLYAPIPRVLIVDMRICQLFKVNILLLKSSLTPSSTLVSYPRCYCFSCVSATV